MRLAKPTEALPLTIFIDGACPLCRREANWLRSLDRGRGHLLLVDITSPDFDPIEHGLTMDHFMAEIHGLLPNGDMIRGMEVFRRAYAAVGLPWLLAPTGWPVVRRLADTAYAWFARNRLRLTGRRDACADGSCRPWLSGATDGKVPQ
jgi:predicted DCC family thiol-disulfide oxidoreductase YuxK